MTSSETQEADVNRDDHRDRVIQFMRENPSERKRAVVASKVLRFRCQECGRILRSGADPNRARCSNCGSVDFDIDLGRV